ncbi:hypothetical protein DRW03_31450 [Corallococcus sp. H22C18031201]|uniref:hypothetical protein n=1 Tax=Citreicoccus inhibens TaxID=2849499 RepID=UPI000E7404CA|nr:hypothetical protein [Citreicoccus inhibens]MBU8894377.1 hypothetical protein [Citreicoccus inhibens]RJS16158.1 hypothetical protein DRW03_31450 [Corallococcus sp. H22C18031201]
MRVHERGVEIAVAGRLLSGRLQVPERASGLVLLAGEPEDGRAVGVAERVAGTLHAGGLATLGLALRTADESEADAWRLRHDATVTVLAHRLEVARDWLQRDAALSLLPVGYLGLGLGAAAVLVASTYQPFGVQAVVTLGGRPDLAGDALAQVRVPTLLLAGQEDEDGRALVLGAFEALRGRKALRPVPGLSRFLEERLPLEGAARMAGAWLHDCFRAVAGPGVLAWSGEQA